MILRQVAQEFSWVILNQDLETNHGNSSPGGLLGRQTDTFAGPIDMNIKSKAPKGPESGSQLMSRMISAFYFEFNCGHKPLEFNNNMIYVIR